MFLKKFLSQPNVEGTALIALLICVGFVFAFGSKGFNVQASDGCCGCADAALAMPSSGSNDAAEKKCKRKVANGKAQRCETHTKNEHGNWVQTNDCPVGNCGNAQSNRCSINGC